MYPSNAQYPSSPYSVPPYYNNMNTAQSPPYPGVQPVGYPGPGGPGYPTPGSGASGYPIPGSVGPGFPQVSPTGPVQPYPNTGSPPPPGLLPEPGPTAPPLNHFGKVQGYENITFDEAVIQPPVAPGWQDQPQPERGVITSMPQLTDEDVKDAVLNYSSEHCCYGKGVAGAMTVLNIERSSAFHYILKTFGEKRESAWRFEPYNGQPIDGPMNGPAPGPWDIQAQPKEYFKDSKLKMEVPHTAFVKPCHTCVGIGRVRCDSCSGRGQSNCTWCHGSGRRFDDPCRDCGSSGNQRCTWCSGTGQVRCKTCHGKAQLKGYVELIITWTNHYEDYISETSALPKEKIRKVKGDTVFNEEQLRVWPITNSGDHGVDTASRDLVNKHNTQFTTERIIKQHHTLNIVPVAKVQYRYKDKNDEFYVYGFENKVYFNKYPQNCCWGCTIL